MTLSETDAQKVFDILVQHAGASESLREQFVYSHTTDDDFSLGHSEWRFQGSLGFGGKFYTNQTEWRVACYPEDNTPERREAISRTNELLAELRQESLEPS